ncbi:uncharacterized protein TrAtP1_003676 [Trichoderma atroviride]|uniref:uncharacterized protein n=1 Tax=Hypocrea atroviridis TaxID=63577 RepID=UPI00331A8B41|nr:hypothetical protein TrAtP1_003676 [Trichoderma atroviride]
MKIFSHFFPCCLQYSAALISVNNNDAADLLGDFTRNTEHAPNLVHTCTLPRFGLDENDAGNVHLCRGYCSFGKRFEIGGSGIYLLVSLHGEWKKFDLLLALEHGFHSW